MCDIGTNCINVPYKGSITRYYTCNFFFKHNVYKMILHVFSSWVCDLLDIMKIILSKLVKVVNWSTYLTSRSNADRQRVASTYMPYTHTLTNGVVLKYHGKTEPC